MNEEKRLEIGDRIEARCLIWQATRSDEHLAEAQQLVDHVLAHVPSERRDATAARMALPRPVSA